ncbi:hypothetical protein QTP88_020215 [Uroleucon formosanum]
MCKVDEEPWPYRLCAQGVNYTNKFLFVIYDLLLSMFVHKNKNNYQVCNTKITICLYTPKQDVSGVWVLSLMSVLCSIINYHRSNLLMNFMKKNPL